MHAIGASRQGNVDSRVDQNLGCVARFFAGVYRTDNLDRFQCELLQFASVQILLTKLDEIDATLRRFSNLLQKPRPLLLRVASKLCAIGDVVEKDMSQSSVVSRRDVSCQSSGSPR
jgi:hypothetical protein